MASRDDDWFKDVHTSRGIKFFHPNSKMRILSDFVFNGKTCVECLFIGSCAFHASAYTHMHRLIVQVMCSATCVSDGVYVRQLIDGQTTGAGLRGR